MIKVRSFALFVAISVSAAHQGVSAQTESPSLNADWNLEVLANIPEESDLGQAVATWLSTRSVQELNAAQTAIALDALSYGGVPAEAMSVRWEGQLVPPSAGAYTFLRGGVPNLSEDWMRVWIGGELVLDTSSKDTLPVPVDLDGSPVAIRVDYARQMTDKNSTDAWPIPCARLLWSRNNAQPVLVGTESLQPNDGEGTGLAGTYFGDAGFQAVHTSRIDACIDLIWDDEKPGSAGNNHAALRAQLASQMTNATYVSRLYEDLGPWDASALLTNATKVMSGADREQVALLLLANPGDFATMNGYAMTELMWQVQPVSTDLVYELLVTWAQLQPRYETKPGEIPGWHRESYLQQNWNRLAHLGRALCGRYSVSGIAPVHVLSEDNYDRLLEETGLARADGSPNLHLIPAACYAGKKSFRQSSAGVLAVIDERLADDSMSGDLRAQWLVAKALARENHTADTPHVGRALRDLERALSEAESVEVRFWVLGELVTRLISLGEDQWALSLLDSIGHQFTEPDQGIGGVEAARYSQVIARWREQAPVYAENAAIAREARRLQGDIDRVVAEVADLERIISDLQEQRQDEEFQDAADAALVVAERDLANAQSRLEAMESAAVEE